MNLHDAVKTQNVTQVCCLLANGADANALDDRGNPPMAYVLRGGVGFVFEDTTRAMVWSLLKAGADTHLAGVGAALVAEANAMVCSGFEANEASAFARMLGVK